MALPYIIYLIFSLLLILLFLRFEENKAFVSLMLLWLFSYPILSNPDYTISINALGFDLPPNRLLFIILTPVFLWKIIKKIHLYIFWNQSLIPRLNAFEGFLLAYVVINIFAIVINFDQIGFRNAIKDCTDLLTFILVFFIARSHVSQKDLALLSKALLIFALASSMVGLYQFFINPDFLRSGRSRAAFDSFIRANGLFGDEYDQGLFLVIAFIIFWEAFPGTVSRVCITALVSAGVFVTMHRLSWITLALAIGTVLYLTVRKNLPLIVTGGLIFLITGLFAWTALFSKILSNKFINDLFTERVQDDTLTVRLLILDFGIEMVGKYPQGIGAFWTPLYNREAYTYGMPFGESGAFVIHNGFLSAGVRAGILGMVAFALYILSALFFFGKNSSLFGKQWYLPLSVLLVYLLFNLTNDFSFWGTQINIFLAILMGAFTGLVETRIRALSPAPAIRQFSGSLAQQGGGREG